MKMKSELMRSIALNALEQAHEARDRAMAAIGLSDDYDSDLQAERLAEIEPFVAVTSYINYLKYDALVEKLASLI